MERVPFLFCECPPARVNSKLLSITRDTLKLDMKGIQGCVEARIKHELLDAFGLVLDGWSDGGRHYIAIFAVFFYTTGIRTGARPPTGCATGTETSANVGI